MKIAITSQNKKTITGHAGKCRRFFIYEAKDNDIVEKMLVETALEESLHHIGLEAHAIGQVDTFITAGMGAGMQNRLNGAGITACITSETDPDTAVQLFLAGELPSADGKAHNHHHSHDHDCGCGGKQ